MGDSLMTVVAIVLAAVLMFIFPLMSVADRKDDISLLSVQNETVKYVDNIRSTGKLSLEDYSKFVQEISDNGDTFNIELELKILDENPGKKSAQTDIEKIGENIYYTMYTTQIMNQINPQDTNDDGSLKYPNGRTLLLKEGDIVSVNVKNTNTTIAQLLRNSFYRVTENDSYQINASHGGIVTVNGK